MKIIVGLVVLGLVALVVSVVARMIWRFFRGDVELESGGSFGKQFFKRDKPETPDDYN